MEPFKILILGILVAIVASLGNGLFHLVKGQNPDGGSAPSSAGRADSGAAHSRKMARALTIRVALSVMLFVLIMIGWYTGLISPHGTPGR
jgi:hypothetical protein